MEIKDGELQFIFWGILFILYMLRKDLKKWGFLNLENYKIFSKNNTTNKEAKSWMMKRLLYISLIAVICVLIFNFFNSDTSSNSSKADRIGQCLVQTNPDLPQSSTCVEARSACESGAQSSSYKKIENILEDGGVSSSLETLCNRYESNKNLGLLDYEP